MASPEQRDTTSTDRPIQYVDDLRSEFIEQEQLGAMASNGAEIAARSARLEGTAATQVGMEGDLERAEVTLAGVQPRYSLVESTPVRPWRERLPETAKLFGGLLILGWLVQQIRSAGFETSIDAG